MSAMTSEDSPTNEQSVKFSPIECYSQSGVSHDLGTGWIKIYETECDFTPEGFFEVLHFLVRNPNINSSILFRADILFDSDGVENIDIALSDLTPEQLQKQCPEISLDLPKKSVSRHVIRRFIPRNDALDKPINQSILYHTLDGKHAVVMVPHVQGADQIPFYHPRVAALAFVHQENEVSISYLPFSGESGLTNRQTRTALNLLKTVWKHGKGNLAGYKKRVHHDQILPQKRVQDRFAQLKQKYASKMIANWVEVTDPAKQVFEQIAIAAFLLELWVDMYRNRPFPGFVDMGCGNGVLLEILLSEGYSGWGLEGHKRKTWTKLSLKSQKAAVHSIVVPAPLDYLEHSDNQESDFGASRNPRPDDAESLTRKLRSLSLKLLSGEARKKDSLPPFHNGIFNLSPEIQEGPFIVSNHADELTGWTPFFALLNNSSFFIVPCCSRNLSGEKFRAPSHGNNWTANDTAPGYFDNMKITGERNTKKHIVISIPTSNELKSDYDPRSPCNDEAPVSADSTFSFKEADWTAGSATGHIYHFVNAAPLAEPPWTQRNQEASRSGQAAETGDLKSLSQKARSKTLSGYQSLCCWVVHLADKCGYLVEREMLRLPSTRNFGIIGRFTKSGLGVGNESPSSVRTLADRMEKVLDIIRSEGGASRARWIGICETDVAKGNDFANHET